MSTSGTSRMFLKEPLILNRGSGHDVEPPRLPPVGTLATLRRNRNLFLPMMAIAIVALAGGPVIALQHMISFTDSAPQPGWAYLDSTAMTSNALGLALLLLCACGGPLALGVAYLHLAGFRRALGEPVGTVVALSTTLGVAVTSAAGATASTILLIEPDRMFNSSFAPAPFPANNGIRQFIGCWLAATYCIVAVLSLAVSPAFILPEAARKGARFSPCEVWLSRAGLLGPCAALACRRRRARRRPEALQPHDGPCSATTAAIAVAMLCAAVGLAASVLPPLWNRPVYQSISSPFTGPHPKQRVPGVTEWFSLTDASMRVGPARPCVASGECLDSVIYFKACLACVFACVWAAAFPLPPPPPPIHTRSTPRRRRLSAGVFGCRNLSRLHCGTHPSGCSK
jgi:hypothetical protein